MSFTETDKLKALGIVHVFETSKPFGDYAACVVLNDGAGISYGINQFTHRSGSLAAVVRKYLATGSEVGREKLTAGLPLLASKTKSAVESLAADEVFKRALKAASTTGEMKAAQRHVAAERYLSPAIEICKRMSFVTPLSLAVVYDSVTHGSWEWISARVSSVLRTKASEDDLAFEKNWITEYIRTRHRWLTEIRRLLVTSYRTKFFLDQIAIGNWELRLPVTVHGVKLTGEILGDGRDPAAVRDAAAVPAAKAKTEAEGRSVLDSVTELSTSAADKFDRVDGVVSALTTRRDAAKSLWTAVGGTISQAVWGVFGFVVGLPRIVWIVVAATAAALMLLYLYRQITLGKIRELRQ